MTSTVFRPNRPSNRTPAQLARLARPPKTRPPEPPKNEDPPEDDESFVQPEDIESIPTGADVEIRTNMTLLFDTILNDLLEPQGDANYKRWLELNLTGVPGASNALLLESILNIILDFHETQLTVDGSKGIYFNRNQPDIMIYFLSINAICVQMISFACTTPGMFKRRDYTLTGEHTIFKQFLYDALFKERFIAHAPRMIQKVIMFFMTNAYVAASEDEAADAVFNVLLNVIDRKRSVLAGNEIGQSERDSVTKALECAAETLEHIRITGLSVMVTEFLRQRLEAEEKHHHERSRRH